jgi:DNA-binding response OmpR family regulator
MPELNGAEILKVLRHITSIQTIPKIIWSTSGADTYKTTCLALGANDYLIKPSRINDLEAIVRHMLSFCS